MATSKKNILLTSLVLLIVIITAAITTALYTIVNANVNNNELINQDVNVNETTFDVNDGYTLDNSLFRSAIKVAEHITIPNKSFILYNEDLKIYANEECIEWVYESYSDCESRGFFEETTPNATFRNKANSNGVTWALIASEYPFTDVKVTSDLTSNGTLINSEVMIIKNPGDFADIPGNVFLIVYAYSPDSFGAPFTNFKVSSDNIEEYNITFNNIEQFSQKEFSLSRPIENCTYKAIDGIATSYTLSALSKDIMISFENHYNEFKGFYLDPNYTESLESFIDIASWRDITLYAKWERTTANINFIINADSKGTNENNSSFNSSVKMNTYDLLGDSLPTYNVFKCVTSSVGTGNYYGFAGWTDLIVSRDNWDNYTSYNEAKDFINSKGYSFYKESDYITENTNLYAMFYKLPNNSGFVADYTSEFLNSDKDYNNKYYDGFNKANIPVKLYVRNYISSTVYTDYLVNESLGTFTITSKTNNDPNHLIYQFDGYYFCNNIYSAIGINSSMNFVGNSIFSSIAFLDESGNELINDYISDSVVYGMTTTADYILPSKIILKTQLTQSAINSIFSFEDTGSTYTINYKYDDGTAYQSITNKVFYQASTNTYRYEIKTITNPTKVGCSFTGFKINGITLSSYINNITNTELVNTTLTATAGFRNNDYSVSYQIEVLNADGTSLGISDLMTTGANYEFTSDYALLSNQDSELAALYHSSNNSVGSGAINSSNSFNELTFINIKLNGTVLSSNDKITIGTTNNLIYTYQATTDETVFNVDSISDYERIEYINNAKVNATSTRTRDIVLYNYSANVKQDLIAFAYFSEADSNTIKNYGQAYADGYYYLVLDFTSFNGINSWVAPVVQKLNTDGTFTALENGWGKNPTTIDETAKANGFSFNFNASSDNKILCLIIPKAEFNSYETAYYIADSNYIGNKYYFDFNLNGGTFEKTPSSTIMIYQKFDQTDYTLLMSPYADNLSKKYYDFAGWYLDQEFNDEVEVLVSEELFSNYSIGDHINVYAKWVEQIVNINYVINNPGYYESTTIKQAAGTNLKIAFNLTNAYYHLVNMPTLVGRIVYANEYDFIGWTTKECTVDDWNKNCVGFTAVDPTNTLVEDGLTLYAMFSFSGRSFEMNWIWDNNWIFFKFESEDEKLELDTVLKKQMLSEYDGVSDKITITYVYVYEKDFSKNKSVIYKTDSVDEAGVTIGALPTAEEFEASMKLLNFEFNYKLIGWSLNYADIDTWELIKTKNDLSNYERITDDYIVNTTTVLYAVCCLESVYETITDTAIADGGDENKAPEVNDHLAGELWKNFLSNTLKLEEDGFWYKLFTGQIDSISELWSTTAGKWIICILIGSVIILALLFISKILGALR